MDNKVENTTTSLTTITLPNSAWINFDISVESASPPCHRYFPPPASPSTYKQLLWRDKAGSVLHCVELVSHLSSLVADWEWWTVDGILKFTSRFPPTHCKCAEVQFSVTHREESFLSVFPYLSDSRTQLGGEKGRRGFLNTPEFTEDHEAHYSETPGRPFTMHTSNASHMQIMGNVICF